MSNTLGKLFSVTSFGESHGAAIGCVVSGCPADMALSAADIQTELDWRKPGTSQYVTQRCEADQVKILSGVFQGITTGAPITLLIENQDTHSADYHVDQIRPGHADYTYWKKYRHYDYRGGGRASARLTAPLVAAAAIAKKWLQQHHAIQIYAYLAQLGALTIEFIDRQMIKQNPFFAPNLTIVPELAAYLHAIAKEGDSIGARVTVCAQGILAGLGEPLFDKLDARIAQAMMSINAVKGVEIGSGFSSITQRGSEHNDPITPDGFLSNHAGGILAGISTGQEIIASIALKPTSSIAKEQKTINKQGEATTISCAGRHDPCVGIRAVPIAEAMLALVVMDFFLAYRVQ